MKVELLYAPLYLSVSWMVGRSVGGAVLRFFSDAKMKWKTSKRRVHFKKIESIYKFHKNGANVETKQKQKKTGVPLPMDL